MSNNYAVMIQNLAKGIRVRLRAGSPR